MSDYSDSEFNALKAQKDELTIQQALREMDARDREYDWICKQLQQAREEVKRLTAEKETCMETISANLVERTQMWKEREQTKEELERALSINATQSKMFQKLEDRHRDKCAELEQVKAEREKERQIYSINIGEANQLIESLYIELEAKDKALETALNSLSAELDRRYKESIGKWNRYADVYEQGKAAGYDMADQLIKSYLSQYTKRRK